MSDSRRPGPDERDPALDAAWREYSVETPPPALDAKILAAAHREAKSRPRPVGEDDDALAEAREPSRWWWGLAAAATIGAIAFGIVQLAPPPPAGEPLVATDVPASKQQAAADRDRQAPAAKAAEPAAQRERAAPEADAAAPASPAPAHPPAPAPAAPSAKRDAPVVSERKHSLEAFPAAEVAAERRQEPPAPEPMAVPAVPPPPAPAPPPAAPRAFPAAAEAVPPAAVPEKREAESKQTLTPERSSQGDRALRAAEPAAPTPLVPPSGVAQPTRSPAAAAPVGGASRSAERASAAPRDVSAADAARAVAPPADYIARIEERLAAGRTDEAARELNAFRDAYPDAEQRLPDRLRAWAATVPRVPPAVR